MRNCRTAASGIGPLRAVDVGKIFAARKSTARSAAAGIGASADTLGRDVDDDELVDPFRVTGRKLHRDFAAHGVTERNACAKLRASTKLTEICRHDWVIHRVTMW